MTTTTTPTPIRGLEPSALTVRLQLQQPGFVTVRLRGELDAGTAAATEDLARLLAAVRPRHVDLELDQLTFLDVGGWRALRDLEAAVIAAAATFAVTTRSPQVERLEALLAPSFAAAPARDLLVST